MIPQTFEELKNGLSVYLENQPLINGKLFSKSENTFRYILGLILYA